MNAALLLCGAVLALLAILATGLGLFTMVIGRRVEAAHPPLGRFVQVGDGRLHILERGTGPKTLVLVHGLGAQLQNFTYALVERLAPEFRVICVDRPGCGYSTRSRAASSLPGQAETMARLLAKLGVQKPIIVGHSYGGALALAIALNHPESAGALALLAPLTHPQTFVPPAFRSLVIRSKFVRKLIAWTIATPLAMAAGARLLDPVFRPAAVPLDFANAAGGRLSLRPGQFFSASSDLVSVNDHLPGMTQRYSSIHIPVAILFGRHDEILSHEEHGTAMESKIKDLAVTLVDGGHMLPIIDPDQTARWIAEFARRV